MMKVKLFNLLLAFILSIFTPACQKQDNRPPSEANQSYVEIKKEMQSKLADKKALNVTPKNQPLIVNRKVMPAKLLSGEAAISPFNVISFETDILDLSISANFMLVASLGFIEVYDLTSFERTKRIEFKKIENFYGDFHQPKLFSADISPQGDKIVFVKEATDGKLVVQIQISSQRTTLLPGNSNLAIRKVRFLDDDNILMATLDNEIILYKLSDRNEVYRLKLNYSSFSNFSINFTSNHAVFADESGEIPYIDISNGIKKPALKGGNLDRVYDIDFVGHKVITGGKDRSISIYDLEKNSVNKYSTDFHIYAVALDKTARTAMFIVNESNQLGLFDIETESLIKLLQGSDKAIFFIHFLNGNRVLAATYNQILFWSTK